MSENKKAKCIMVQGTMSGAGKSLLCAALCRIFAQDGLHTAPFKSQNMALNSFVTRDGLEMGRAQVVQAQAAGVEPDVRMNPILLKPSSDVGSQVIVNGEVRGQMKASQYFKMKKSLIPDILRAYNSLAEDFDVIVIEGAGSPAEINLKADDIVNMGLAKLVDAPVLLVGDIDRGGVFAQLFGTVELLETDERDRIKGLVINKFRGDVEILRPGLSMLEDKTHLPVLGVVPYLRVDIEDEDSLSERLEKKDAVRPLDIAVIRLPHISNFTDFMVLEQHPLMDVRYVQNTRELGAPDLVILPGTKNTVEDLLWLRQSGLEAVILKLAAKETPVLGVCGGYQMLGETLHDPDGSESGRPQTLRGLNLLPTETTFCAEKHRAQVTGEVIAAPFTGAMLTGYEIHTGNTIVRGEPFCTHADGTKEGCTNQNVFGTYLHGLFDSGELTEKLAKYLCVRKGIDPVAAVPVSMEEYQASQACAASSAAAASTAGSASVISADSNDVAMLAALIECEAGGESYTGMVAVGAVVVNRVNSGSFPNSVSGVIYQSGQFTPVATGTFQSVLARGARSDCYAAAQAALAGESPVGGCLYFNSGYGSGIQIGYQHFY
mgnify:CR=1 FL=1